MFVSCGAWKSIRELEDSISIDELGEFYESIVEVTNRKMRFDAALQGVDIEESIPRSTGSSDLIEVDGKKIPLNSDSTVIDITTPDSLNGLSGLGSIPFELPEIVELHGN